MRKCFVLAIAVAALGVAGQASAEQVDLGKRSVSEIHRACDKVGGSFSVSFDNGLYGCLKQNCDGKGGDCVVACDKNDNCIGSTPGRVTPPPGKYDLVKILKFSPRVPPGNGLLEPGQGASPHGPSGLGTPKPTTPPTGQLY